MFEEIKTIIKKLNKFLYETDDVTLQAMILNAKLELMKILTYEGEMENGNNIEQE